MLEIYRRVKGYIGNRWCCGCCMGVLSTTDTDAVWGRCSVSWQGCECNDWTGESLLHSKKFSTRAESRKKKRD